MEYRVKEKQVRDWRQEKDTLIISAAYTRNNLEIFDFCLKKRGASYTPVRLITREIRYYTVHG